MAAPDQQVLDRRGEPAFATLRIGVAGAAEARHGIAQIAGGEVGNHRIDLGDEPGGGHAQRLENALGHHRAELLSGQPLDDQAEQQEVGVAVEEAAARREVEMAVARDDRQEIFGAGRSVEPVAAQPQQLEEIRQAAGIAHHLVDGDRKRLQLRQVCVRRRGEVELAVVGQHQRGGDGELLAHRSDAEARPRRDRHAELEAGEAIALADLDDAAAHHGDHGARRGSLGVTGEPRIDAAFE